MYLKFILKIINLSNYNKYKNYNYLFFLSVYFNLTIPLRHVEKTLLNIRYFKNLCLLLNNLL